MKPDSTEREIGWTIKKVFRLIPKDRNIAKNDFEAILDEIVMSLHRNRKIPIEALAEKTSKVINDMPSEYGSLPKTLRTWEGLVAYLYQKYLKELGQV
jgi:hypothetical protein